MKSLKGPEAIAAWIGTLKTTLEETKGERFDQVSFADTQGAVETIKNFSANISKRS